MIEPDAIVCDAEGHLAPIHGEIDADVSLDVRGVGIFVCVGHELRDDDPDGNGLVGRDRERRAS